MPLSVDRLSKSYGPGSWAIRDLSLDVAPGVLGLLGPNGVGKTTLIRILATVMKPSSGRILWNGVDIAARPEALRRVLGYLPQRFGVYPHLSGREFLQYFAAVKGLSRQQAAPRIQHLLR